MKLASWNVNSIKARKEHALRWLEEKKPDVLMVQELKGLEFPEEDFKTAGYETAYKGQKAYNGVAILSKNPTELIHNSLPGMEQDEQARYLEVHYNGIRVIDIYAPNGNPCPGEKFEYKLTWMEALYQRLKTLREEAVPFLIGGDFNIIPEDRDVHNPASWINDALFQPESRGLYRKYLNLGLYDALRLFHDDHQQYTFWDYTGGAYQQNKGIRIDHFLMSPCLTDKCIGCHIDAEPRGWERPSDHTPIIVELAA